MRRGREIAGVDLDRVVTTAPEPVDIFVRQMRHDRLQLGILVEKMLAIEAAVGSGVGLKLAVDGFVQSFQDDAFGIAREQWVPVRAPQHLDDVPAGARVQPLQLLDDRTVAAHRPIQPLQIAIDDEDEIVETFARRERKPGDGLRFVHLAVAHEAPYLARGRLQNAAIGEVAHEARLVDRVQRAEPHRTRRELPETRHQPWVTVGRQSLACGFTPVIRQIFLGKPPFQKSARIDARRGMRLEVHRITVRASAEKMVVSHFEQVRG